MTTANVAADIGSLERLYELLPGLNYEPLWTIKGALTPEPATRMVPHLWHYDEVRDLIVRAGELTPPRTRSAECSRFAIPARPIMS
jgi:gentisate 1,2-dioxygenase